MLKYSGKLYFDKPLSDEELSFLQGWQNKLTEINVDYFPATKEDREVISERINAHTGIAFNGLQRWAIFQATCPLIEFHKDYIECNGISHKGQLRESIMAYHHFFFSKEAVLKECLDLSFLKPHNLNGIIEGYRKDERTNKISQWCYVVKDNNFTSVEVPTISLYESNPDKWEVTNKEDNFYTKCLLVYFPPLMQYAEIKRSINEASAKIDSTVEKKPKKLKV